MFERSDESQRQPYNSWWGYVHINGKIQVKRYFDQEDIREAEQSDFVDHVIYPFQARDRDEAIQYVTNQIK